MADKPSCAKTGINEPAIAINLSDISKNLFNLARFAEELGLNIASKLLSESRLEIIIAQIRESNTNSNEKNFKSIVILTYLIRFEPINVTDFLFIQKFAENIEVNIIKNRNITSGWSCSRGWFLHVVEGVGVEVLNVLSEIRSDLRQPEIHVIDWHQAGSRLFGRWTMGFAGEAPARLIEEEWSAAALQVSAAVPSRPSQYISNLHSTLVDALAGRSRAGS